ncbi:hypothetical protein [Microbacterium aurantiacum]|uniref:Uncharacterized protein n=1 Tax=Microbacterium aurantiacum TaxID=162393 RepID=A0AAJ2LVP7_9MICO|nr:hypothetical protein [Microbacterium aurantiacum]MDS0244842.1 hypothetical protein [Microbacterium aurantiacum]
MEATHSTRSRTLRLALAGCFLALAWLTLSLVATSVPAHADDGERDRPGLLGAVVDVVDTAADSVTGTVDVVGGTVGGVAESAVEVAPAPVAEPVSAVVETVGEVAQPVTQPVAEVVTGGAVESITAPVVDLVTEVPVVGTVVTGIGADDAVADLSSTADRSLGAVVETVSDTGESVGLPPVAPAAPDIDPVTPAPTTPPIAEDITNGTGTVDVPSSGAESLPVVASLPVGVVSASSSMPSVTSAFAASPDAISPAVPTAASVVSGADSSPTTSFFAGGLCLPAAASGPGGTGPGVLALAALGPLVAHRAWVRRGRLENHATPPAPLFATDVSPD